MKRTNTTSMFDRELNAFEAEYQHEIIDNMKRMEFSTLADVTKIDLQPEITWVMRSEIINFMIYVHSNLRLSPNTLFLAINIFDRYCSKRVILLEHRDLVSSTAISIAAKYLEEKRRTPTINQLKKIMGGEFTDFQFAETEIHILSTLGFTVGHPTCESFLDIIFPKDTGITVRHVARYLCEMSFYHRDFLNFTSSMIAYSAKILTLHIFNIQSLNCAENLGLMAANEDFIHCLSLLANHIQRPSAYLHMKYSDSSLSHAAQVVEAFVVKYNEMMTDTSSSATSSSSSSSTSPSSVLGVDASGMANLSPINTNHTGSPFNYHDFVDSPMSIRSEYSSYAQSPMSTDCLSPVSSIMTTATTISTATKTMPISPSDQAMYGYNKRGNEYLNEFMMIDNYGH